ncbi:diheme cytochrome c [Sulfurimonas sp.]|uniref:diheme cytochrome c n=1 Tax=Sulfurimonas sp. TaxID=2022749 RepID=UPI00286DA62E|nr:diheme cytochrome c [Sulfurimonas sp.]
MKKVVFASLLVVGSLVADGQFFGSKKDVAPVTNDFYIKECASCHFAYQPGLLPSRSWKKVMENLNDHFGTDASLEPEDKKKILKYLVDNSAEKFTNYKRSKKINDSIPAVETPIAVTKTRYFIQKHKELKPKMIEQKDVKSLANCMACHTKADKGSYSEQEINIPNYGKWEDD